jgi:regulatory factor X
MPQDAYGYGPVESLLMASTSQLVNAHGFALDPSLGNGMDQRVDYSSNTPCPPNGPVSHHQFEEFAPYAEHQQKMVDNRSEIPEDDVDQTSGDKPAGRASKRGKSGETNDLDLKRLFQENQHRKLEEIAVELHANERGPQSERTRQIFAMNW